MAKGLTPKQIATQLSTWENAKTYEDIYKEIKSLAEQTGILTKKGKVSKAQSKLAVKRREEFTRLYKQRFGSKTSYEKKQRELWKKNIIEGYEGTFQQFKELSVKVRDYSKLVSEMFNRYPSAEAYEVYMYTETLEVEEGISYLNDFLGYTQKPKTETKKENESDEPPYD